MQESSYRSIEVEYNNEDEGEQPTNDESGDESTLPVAVSGYGGCAVCGDSSTKKCSIRKVIKYWQVVSSLFKFLRFFNILSQLN